MPSLSFLRPRFSIRALLVVMTLLALFFGYHLSWIHQRRAVLASSGYGELTEVQLAPPNTIVLHAPQAPGLLWMFGEEGYSFVRIDALAGSREYQRVSALFPESTVLAIIPFPEQP